MKKEHTAQQWCEVIAWLINSDNLKLPFQDKDETAENCWKCSSHGELSGILSAIEFINSIYSEEESIKITDTLKICIAKILDGQEIVADKKYSTGLGLFCISMMYQVPSKVIDMASYLTSISENICENTQEGI